MIADERIFSKPIRGLNRLSHRKQEVGMCISFDAYVVNSLLEKYDEFDADVLEEINALRVALERQKQILRMSVEQEVGSIKALGEMLSQLE